MNRGYQGRALENAIEEGFKHYKKLGRAVGEKRHNGSRKIKGVWRPVISSGADFSGTLAGGRGLHVEAKETGRTAWPLADISDAEIKHLDKHHTIGAQCLLVIDFTSIKETYAIDWAHVAMFLKNPWRESLSLDWCRAFGCVVENVGGTCLFLDGVAHVDAEECMRVVDAEKTRGRQLSLVEKSTKRSDLVERINRPVPKTAEEYRARILEAADAGMRRQLKGARR